MSYLDEMSLQLENQNFPRFLQLWEEYKSNNEISASETIKILENVKFSEYAQVFGQYSEETLSFLDKLDDPSLKPDLLRLIIDLQTSQSELLAQEALKYLTETYSSDPLFKEKIRLVGLRSGEHFQGAIRNFELLNHMEKGKFIFHTGGWGAGEILDISLIREQLSIEFENIIGARELSFKNAFKNLEPLPSEHFLAMRYGDPDLLEANAKKDPLEVFKLLLSDLGPLNAQEVKEEMFELVIPAEDWVKWWQTARSKAKKDPKVQIPKSSKQPFVLLDKEVSFSDDFKKLLEKDLPVENLLVDSFNFLKQHSEVLKDSEIKTLYREKLLENLSTLEEGQELLKIELYLFLEEFFQDNLDNALLKVIQEANDISFLVKSIGLSPLKKKFLMMVRKHREDWDDIFSNLFFSVNQHFLREYILKELMNSKNRDVLEATIQKLLDHPVTFPECFTWYFQKIQTKPEYPFSDKAGKELFFEALFILLYHIENSPEQQELTKKVHTLIISDNFQLFRDNIAKVSIEFVREILLLVSKCQLFSSHDLKVFLSLAKVVHPNLEPGVSSENQTDELYIWTTQEGYMKTQERIKKIATVDTVENAKEIEVARAYGDLRENAEYKFAQERRARLQGEMKLLSTQINQARIISPEDIDTKKVSVGTIVSLVSAQGDRLSYTILGPWDADPDKGILSFQSQLAKSMIGQKVNDTFDFKADTYTVKEIKSYLGSA
ncbi:MAG: Transcription elongation factor GreA [Chlamydiae bacterium]|nr:Transcription elongation factor GreA [Chlamydiota bacterium]